MISIQTLLLLALVAPETTVAFSASISPPVPTIANGSDDSGEKQQKDRPLLRQFGRGIDDRVLKSKEGSNRFGLVDHYTSAETIPCLDMKCGAGGNNDDIASRNEIRQAYTAGDNTGVEGNGMHGRSSGSGCSIIRLRGKDAVSVRGLVNFADRFFEGVDDDNRNKDIKDVGVFRIANNVHAGFDQNVNLEGKMQALFTKIIPGQTNDEDPLLLPMEVGDLVGTDSLSDAHRGMNALFNISSQITSAVLGMDSVSSSKLLDDGSYCRQSNEIVGEDAAVSNSYQRLIRYLKPQQATAKTEAAFWPHVDSTFLTMIPMPELPGLEVWCPSKKYANSTDLSQRGEWVRPIKPSVNDESIPGKDDSEDDCVYVIALSGEFLQLLSDGQVPTCIHCVVPPSDFSPEQKYIPRISAPLFVRPRRGDEAVLDVRSDLKLDGSESDSIITESESKGLYFEEGIIEECDSMRVWDYMECMSPNN